MKKLGLSEGWSCKYEGDLCSRVSHFFFEKGNMSMLDLL